MVLFVVLLSMLLASVFAQDKTMCALDTEKQIDLVGYWISVENTKDYDEQGNDVMLDGAKDTELKLCGINDKGPLVSLRTSTACTFQELCKLEDGSIYSYDSPNKCFVKLDAIESPWGLGPERPLAIFTSVAAIDIPLGTKMEIKELKGLKLPNGKEHNGCVRVDDECRLCDPGCKEIVFHIGLFSNLKAIEWPRRVSVIASECEIMKYD